jgi:diaminopimelate decarboxylase
MHHFAYRDGALFAEDVDLREIAAEVGTPVYVYSSATIERHYRLYEAAMPRSLRTSRRMSSTP